MTWTTELGRCSQVEVLHEIQTRVGHSIAPIMIFAFLVLLKYLPRLDPHHPASKFIGGRKLKTCPHGNEDAGALDCRITFIETERLFSEKHNAVYR